MTQTRFTADRATYIRSNTQKAALAMAVAMAVLWIIGNPYIWTGAIAGLGGIGVRAWYLASEELAAVWVLDADALSGPGERRVRLDQIKLVRSMGSMVQIITTGGDKHLIKYQTDPAATIARIRAAQERGHT